MNENNDHDAKAGTLTPPGFYLFPSPGLQGGPQSHTQPSITHLVPLGPEFFHGDRAVRVAGTDPDAVALNHLLYLVLDGHDGLPLAVRLRQRGLELLVCSD